MANEILNHVNERMSELHTIDPDAATRPWVMLAWVGVAAVFVGTSIDSITGWLRFGTALGGFLLMLLGLYKSVFKPMFIEVWKFIKRQKKSV